MNLPFKRSAVKLVLVLVTLSAFGCAHYPLNSPLAEYPHPAPYEPDTLRAGDNTGSLLVCLTFSGGGTRAAAMSYGVLEELRRTQIEWEGVRKTLLDEVDCISSVSGGSFTSAYYGLFGDRIFEDFREKFLDRNIQGELFRKVFLNPVNWFRLASSKYSRIDLAAKLYNDTIFEGRTFADLRSRKQAPFILLNATNVGSGHRFSFRQRQFDYIGSDLSEYPVARAVAASSAFPFLLNPISLKNYRQPSGFETPTRDVHAMEDYYRSARAYQTAAERLEYLDKEATPWVHLMDGGVSDNIGLRAIDESFRETRGMIRSLINRGVVKTLVVIVVNAKTQSQDKLSMKESPPGLLAVAQKTMTVAMGNYSFETIQLTNDKAREREQTQRTLEDFQKILDECDCDHELPKLASPFTPYVIELNFEAIPDESRRRYYLDLPTSFKLSEKQVDSLIEIGPELLARHPQWKQLKEAIGVR